jgi:hypothetical protein
MAYPQPNPQSKPRDVPSGRRPIERRQPAPVRRLVHLNRELELELAQLNRKRRLREIGLMAAAIVAIVLCAGFILTMAPRCSDDSHGAPAILIGDAIKVAGCS